MIAAFTLPIFTIAGLVLLSVVLYGAIMDGIFGCKHPNYTVIERVGHTKKCQCRECGEVFLIDNLPVKSPKGGVEK